MSNKKLNAIITIGGEIAGSLRTAIGSTTSQLSKIGSEIQRVKKQQSMLGESIRTFGSMGKNVDNLRARYSGVTDELNRLTRAQEKLNHVENLRLDNQRKFQDLKGQIGSTVAQAVAVGASLYATVSASSDFNYNMQMIGNTANMSAEQIKSMKNEIMETSKFLGATVQDVQTSQGFLIAAGMSEDVATKMLRPVGMAAVAAGAAIEDVSKAAFTLNDTLAVAPSAMKDNLGILVQAGKEGNFEFKAMAQYLPTLGASFKALKMEGSEAAATMGAALQIARKGAGDESEAANNMKNFMAKILSPDTLKKANKFGVDLYAEITKAQANGGNPFEVAMQNVMKMTKGGDQKLLGELFGDMQVQNFVRPMIQNWDEYERVKLSALSAGGDVIDEDFAKMGATTKSGVGGMVAAFGRLKITIGDSLEPVVNKFANALIPVINGISGFVTENPRVVGGLIALLAGFTALKVGVLGFKLAMIAVKSPFINILGTLDRHRAGITLSGISFTRFIPIIKQIGFALMRTPWGIAAAAAVAAGVLIYKYWDRIKAFFSGFWTGLKQGLEPAIKSFTDLYKSMTWLEPVIQMIGNGIGIVYDWFMKLIAPTKATDEQLRNATSAGESFGKIVGGAINIALAPAKALMGVLEWIHKHIGGVIGQVADLANKAPSVGSFFGSVKSTFGFGASEQKKPQASRAVPYRTAGPAPQIRGANTKSIAPQQHITQSFTVTAAPGQNPNEIANLVMQKLKSANAVAQRGSMIDAGYAQ
ncbi:phage tail tape measure protein [Acinetobacter johnsonii]|uniref:phage tail tape measure protein n=1 Tax=Acinetobacter johnsonii TaxID=40214 RepID=UPI002936D05C|nr:phage tail tape measure protein [Acinetobacter johnsonii]MDV2486363.1 phage tail tape measure protein [Acinetobacter johnsonii]